MTALVRPQRCPGLAWPAPLGSQHGLTVLPSLFSVLAPPPGHQQGQTAQGPLGGAGPSTEGR